MTKEVKIHQCSNADDTELRCLEVKIGKKSLTTPTKAISTNNFYKDTSFPEELSDLQELFLRFNEESLTKLNEDTKESAKKNNILAREKAKANNSPHFCLLEFKNKGESWRYPTESEIEILTNTAYSHSEITPIPSIPKVARKLDAGNSD